MKFIVNGNSELKAQLFFEENIENSQYAELKERGIFSAKKGEVYYVPNVMGKGTLLVGLGQETELTLDDLRLAFFKVAKSLLQTKESSVELNIPKLNQLCNAKIASAITEGMLQATYKYNYHKNDSKLYTDLTIYYNPVKGKEEKVEHAIRELEKVMEGVFLTRDLVNEPANIMTPTNLSETAKNDLEKLGVKVKIFNRQEIEELNMHAFLSVARASSEEPKLIVMEYFNNPDSKQCHGLVGKGLTYDCGGLAIKPALGMVDMHCDMGGSATVIGAMHAIASNKLKVNVVAVVASCENMISGNSFRNGDIINSMSGKTIEILNTDAEGRLTLADAVYYACTKYDLTHIIDIATLTGACVACLGEEVTGTVTNNHEFLNDLLECSKLTGEHIWEMPTIKYFKEMNDSEVADIKNIGGKFGGMQTAGLFVGSFVTNDLPSIHLDIAGTAYRSQPYGYLPSRASGIMVKTLYQYFKSKMPHCCHRHCS